MKENIENNSSDYKYFEKEEKKIHNKYDKDKQKSSEITNGLEAQIRLFGEMYENGTLNPEFVEDVEAMVMKYPSGNMPLSEVEKVKWNQRQFALAFKYRTNQIEAKKTLH